MSFKNPLQWFKNVECYSETIKISTQKQEKFRNTYSKHKAENIGT